MLSNGTDICSCPNTDCKRNRNCVECQKYHTERGSLPKCQRDAATAKAAQKDA